VDRGRSDDKDFVEECMEATKDLRACMEANAEYYGPLLEAEKEERRKVEHALHEVKEELWQTKQATPPPLWMSCRSGVCRILFGSSIGRVVIQPGSLRPAPARPPLTRRVTRGDR